MKIDEAIKMINRTTTANAILIEDCLFISDATEPSVAWFLSVPKQAIGWEEVRKQYGLLETVIPADLAHVMDVIQQLLDTPVKDRFPKKHYRVRLRGLNSDGGHQYLTVSTQHSTISLGSVFAAAWNTGLKQTFTADELNKIRERFKGSKWIISMMKDGVEEVGKCR